MGLSRATWGRGDLRTSPGIVVSYAFPADLYEKTIGTQASKSATGGRPAQMHQLRIRAPYHSL